MPCGKCYECLREKQQEWCFRIDQELRHCNISFFVTLTYSNENLLFADDEPALYKRHLQLHFKKLRKPLEPRSIKYYAVGEYGDRSDPGRPHYHYILFYSGNVDRFKLMNLIKESWEYGISQVLPVHGAQGYVTKYILKFDNREHVVKPFSMISNGLGISYLSDQMIKYHQRGLVPYAMKPGGYKVNLPRYYKDKIFSTYSKFLMKKRADMQRRELDLIRLDRYDMLYSLNINPFKKEIYNYQNCLYQSMKIYRQKKKI